MDDALTEAIVSLDDSALIKAHARLDVLEPKPNVVTAHHLVVHEMERRDLPHGHDPSDPWHTVTVEVDRQSGVPIAELTAEMPPEVAAQVVAEVGEGNADVTTLLTMSGYAQRIDAVPEFAKATYTPPEAVQAAARQALKWIADGRAGDGFTSVGRGRAEQLAAGRAVSREVLVKMRAYFARHIVDKDADGWGDRSDPTPGMVAWYAWGGDAGRAWANSALDDVEKAETMPDDPEEVDDAVEAYDEVESQEQPDTLAGVLDELLAATFTVYLQAHGYHWNVTGSDFTQYHALFGEIAADTYSSIDPIAENIRKLGGFPSWPMSRMLGLSEVDEPMITEGDAKALIPELLASTVILIEELKESFDAATRENQQGIANFLSERIDMHQKWAWQLRSSLSEADWESLDLMDEERILSELTDEDKAHLAMLAAALDSGDDPEPHVPVSLMMKMEKRGNPDALRRYWRQDPKGKVGWGGGGDFTRCVAAVSKYMDPEQAKGFCAIRHKEATGMWPGDKRNRMNKHGSHDQSTHGHGKGAGSVAPRQDSGSGMSREQLRSVGNDLGRKAASAAYNDGYDQAVRHREDGADMTPMLRNRAESLRSSRSQHSQAAGSEDRQIHASIILDSAGYLDGAAGKRRAIRRTLLGGYNPLDLATAKAAEPMLKHPGHGNQKVHGRRGSGGSGGSGEYGGYTLKDPDNPAAASPDPASNAAAKRRRDQVAAIEPEITRDMIDIGNANGATLEGLDFRLKSEKSLARKINDEKGEEKNGGDPEKTADNMSDVARYTMTFPDDQYTAGTEGVLKGLEAQGYALRVKNYWQDGDPYQGINVAAVHPNGTAFELQFHTPTSFDFKESRVDKPGAKSIHDYYETYRTSDDPRVRWETYDSMTRASNQIPLPKDYDRLMTIGTPLTQPFKPRMEYDGPPIPPVRVPTRKDAGPGDINETGVGTMMVEGE